VWQKNVKLNIAHNQKWYKLLLLLLLLLLLPPPPLCQQQQQQQQQNQISEKEITVALRIMPKWKTRRRDLTANFWLNKLRATHKYLAALFNKLIEENHRLEWLMTGVTLLIPKNEKTENPENYRPVTSLPML
jgi:hypothetical protein